MGNLLFLGRSRDLGVEVTFKLQSEGEGGRVRTWESTALRDLRRVEAWRGGHKLQSQLVEME